MSNKENIVQFQPASSLSLSLTGFLSPMPFLAVGKEKRVYSHGVESEALVYGSCWRWLWLWRALSDSS